MCIKHCHQLEYNVPYYKCSKCVVRHLGKAPPSPRNVFKFPLKIDKYL